jgi:hypothetical protein
MYFMLRILYALMLIYNVLDHMRKTFSFFGFQEKWFDVGKCISRMKTHQPQKLHSERHI